MDTIGKYNLVRIIGEGGMGRVYEAIDPIIGRRVAIKTISLNVASDAETLSRFFREAQAAGRLSHPNLITIHDIGDADGTPYLVMEFLEGMDLSRKIRQDRLSYDTKVQMMIEVCEGLAFAHGHDIIHRDIKPANIFVTTTGRIKILDFGLARGALSEITQTGKILGTPNYMAPEQIRGEEVDHRADIFSAGVVFYELLSGRKAFEGDSIATTLYKVLETHPQPVHLLDAQLPAAISGVIERALAKDRLARFQTSSEMLDALVHAHGRTTHIERPQLPTAPAQTPSVAAAPPVPRGTSTLARWALVGLIVAGLAGFALWSQRAQNTSPSPLASQPDPGPRPSAPVETSPPVATPPSPPAVAAAPLPAGNNAAVKTTVPKAPAVAGKPAPSPVASPSVAQRPAPAPEPRVESAAAAPPPATLPPAAPPEPRATPIEPPPVVAPPVVAPPVSPPPPPPAAASPAPRAEENPVAAVQAVLARYRAALEARDIGALKRIWPALSGRQEDALRNEFEHARAIVVGLDGVDIRPTITGATVTCRRTYAVTTADGQTLRTATTMSMTLAGRDGAWSIETIRHEVAR